MLPPACPTRVRAGALLGALVLLTACSDSRGELDLEGLGSGPCSDLVGSVEDVDRTLRAVEDEDSTPQEAAQRFQAVQEELKTAADTAEPPVRTAVTDLVTRLGFFRISVDSNSYDGSEEARVLTALESLVESCRSA